MPEVNVPVRVLAGVSSGAAAGRNASTRIEGRVAGGSRTPRRSQNRTRASQLIRLPLLNRLAAGQIASARRGWARVGRRAPQIPVRGDDGGAAVCISQTASVCSPAPPLRLADQQTRATRPTG
jgi:hypothetical protein